MYLNDRFINRNKNKTCGSINVNYQNDYLIENIETVLKFILNVPIIIIFIQNG